VGGSFTGNIYVAEGLWLVCADGDPFIELMQGNQEVGWETMLCQRKLCIETRKRQILTEKGFMR